jgi:acyl-coenzyme A synthetase/AMP-(fatty) acid ligase/pimeloyl-ACP methyl ester carboxylesterase
VGRTWHVLDNQVTDAAVTLLCVHGNPTWSYLWRRVLESAPPGVRVVAVDQLNMGFSERTGRVRRLEQRVEDLQSLTDTMQLTDRVVTLGHDWGGAISLGWAVRNVDRLAGVIVTNTAVHQPAGSPAPTLIRLARAPGLLALVTRRTPMFVEGTLALSRPGIAADVRRGYRAPYRSAGRRAGIHHFVADIPLDPRHPSFAALAEIAAGLDRLADTPTLMLWGPSDPVFADRYLHDLHDRLPHAAVHRFEGAGHLVPQDVDLAGPVYEWIAALDSAAPASTAAPSGRPVWAGLDDHADDPSTAVVDVADDGTTRTISFSDLHADVARIGCGLRELGVRPGDRVGLLVPPGIDLPAVLYACWRIGAVVVVVDAGLGARGIGRALRSAAPDVLVGIPRAIAAARMLGWPGRRVVAGAMTPASAQRLLGAVTLDEVREAGATARLPEAPSGDALAAVAFTSGSTGPAKGVRYRHHQLQAQRDALTELFSITSRDRLVAAFGPFALYGPAMGIPSVVPAMDATSPGTLTASALGEAIAAVDATLVFASPAALRNVIATAKALDPAHRDAMAKVRVVMSAGAPISPALLGRLGEVLPNAEPHTPYGMTEVLPVADITLAGIDAAGEADGVCVGRPLPGVDVAILPIDRAGRAGDDLTNEPGVVGELCIRAAHMRDGYDKLWATEASASRPSGWHRSGDVGHLDGDGRLWIEGRTAHLIVTADGPVTPVGVEHAAESVPGVAHAAAVGVGPKGTQQLVVVVETDPAVRRPDLASPALTDAVRDVVAPAVAAVLVVPELPTDRRHNSKIERTRIARWAANVLAGGRMRRL